MTPPPRPDPERGVFETLLVVEGRPVELEAHLARLGASLRALFGCDLEKEARDIVLGAAASLRLSRLRLTAKPRDDHSIALDATTAEVDPAIVFPTAEGAAALRSVVVPGGLGKRKWIDRGLLEDPGDGSTVPLLVDRDETVLEASRANVFAVREGVLVTPQLDGRILPGTARARVIELAAASVLQLREARLTMSDLLDSDEVFLTGSVRGVEPVRSIDGVPVQAAGEVTQLVARELRRRWFD